MTGRKFRTILLASLIAALLTSGLSVLLNGRLKAETGLRTSFYPDRAGSAEPHLAQVRKTIDLDFLRGTPAPSRFSVQWEGYWFVPASGVYEFSVSADDFAAVWMDGRSVAEARVKMAQPVLALHPLRAGIHEFKAVYKQYAGAYDVRIECARAGNKLGPIDGETLFPEKPDAHRLRTNRLLLWLQRFSWFLWLVPSALLGFAGISSIMSFLRSKMAGIFTPRIKKVLGIAIPCLIVLYGTALRYEAVLSRFRPVPGSDRMVACQAQIANWISRLRPDPHWDKETRPYAKGDPGGYLRFAREMKNFYAGHVREPVFVFATKVFLHLLNQQDVAVSFASAFFSALTILATYLLGSAAFSRWTGALASLSLAIEREVIRCGTAGLRDDAFMFFTVLFAYAGLRLYRKASLANVILAGFVGGGACLARVTALSFVIPTYGFLLLVSRPWRERILPVAASAVLAGAVLAPYLIGCAITYGDPLYAINDTTKFYRAREHYQAGESMGVGEYLRMKMTMRPYQFLNTALVGLTGYPLNNKWDGFDYLNPFLGRLLYWAAIPGLFLFVFSAGGRLILVVLFTSILPFAFTWDVKGGAEYRFTVHAYPLYLIAAGYALVQVMSLLRRSRIAEISAYLKAHKRNLAIQVCVAVAVVLLGWFGYRSLQDAEFEEALEAGERVRIAADSSGFFGKGWSGPVQMKEERLRISEDSDSRLRLPLRSGSDYGLELAIDPLMDEPATGHSLRVFLNETSIATVQFEKKGSALYGVSLPKDQVRPGVNDIRLQSPAPFALSSVSVSTVP